MLQEGIVGIANVMKKFYISYACYFIKYKRGPLFQDSLRAKFRQDPVLAGIIKLVGEYKCRFRKKAMKEYINQDAVDIFIDVQAKTMEMNEGSAKRLFDSMYGTVNDDSKVEKCQV